MIDDKAFEEALKRHEENFERELSEVNIKEVVLKTKKSVLEQARLNNAHQQYLEDHRYQIRNLQTSVDNLKQTVYLTQQQLAVATKAFTESTSLLNEIQSDFNKTKKALERKMNEKTFFEKVLSFFR